MESQTQQTPLAAIRYFGTQVEKGRALDNAILHDLDLPRLLEEEQAR